MITAKEIKPYKNVASHYEETQRLKQRFHKLKQTRKPFYLTYDDFDKILYWKLRGQYGRQREIREANTNEIIKKISLFALNLYYENEDYELELKIKALISIRGVEIRVASAILALCFPERYAVIDSWNWQEIYGVEKKTFTINDYKKYLKTINRFADKLNWFPQEVDIAIWGKVEQQKKEKSMLR